MILAQVRETKRWFRSRTLKYMVRLGRFRARARVRSAEVPLLDDPIECLYRIQGGGRAAFRLAIDQCTHQSGLNHYRSGWNPFVTTARDVLIGVQTHFPGSVLEDYYQRFQPRSAAEALAGFGMAPRAFRELPPACLFLSPWTAWSSSEVLALTRLWARMDGAEHGASLRESATLRLKFFGPVPKSIGEFEFSRIERVLASLQAKGFDRTLGDVHIKLLKRGSELRYLTDGGGFHRVIAAHAAGMDELPATFTQPYAIDIDAAADWPHVRSGLWSEAEARAYVDHLFEFDMRTWAMSRDLA